MTLTVPDGLVLQDGKTTSFSKTIYFQSNQRSLDPKDSIINRKNNTSYHFNVTIQLNLGEYITFYANWTAVAQTAGNYTISFSVFSHDPNIDPEFRACEDTCSAQVVEDIPLIDEPLMSPVYRQSDLDPREIFIYPKQDMTIRCNITSSFGLKNVTLYYSADVGQTWSYAAMTKSLGNEWIGNVPGQPEGSVILLHVKAFSLDEKSSVTGEYACTVADLQALDVRAKIVAATAVTGIMVGCAAILAAKRRRMASIL